LHRDAPATPGEVYDQIGALHAITAGLPQHLDRIATALDRLSHDERLRSSDDVSREQMGIDTRNAAFQLSGVAGEKVAGLVRELNEAWSAIAGLSLEDPADNTTAATVDTATVDTEAADTVDADDGAQVKR